MAKGTGEPPRVSPSGGSAKPPQPPGSTPSSPGGRHTAAPSTAPTTAPTTGAVPEVNRTRTSGTWVGVTVAAVVLILLLIFIVQNSKTVQISFFGAHGHLSLGVALLLAAAGGVILVAIPGYGRIIQLRRIIKRAGATPPSVLPPNVVPPRGAADSGPGRGRTR